MIVIFSLLVYSKNQNYENAWNKTDAPQGVWMLPLFNFWKKLVLMV